MNETAVTFNTRVARAMRASYEGEKTGALISQTADAKRLVFIERGYLVGAKSEAAEERLGEVMVADGRISREQLEEATRFIRSGRKLGRILVELGYLKGGEIESCVRRQIVRIASSMLISNPDRLVFSTAVPIEAVTLSPISIGDVFLAAASYLTDVDLYRENVLIDDYVLAQTNDAFALAGQMKLTPEEARVLDLVNEKNTVGEILAAGVLAEDRSLRLLVALHQAGIVSLKEKKPSETPGPRPTPAVPAIVDPFEKELTQFFNDMQCQNHWQVLGLRRDAACADIDRAYRDRASRFDPEKYQHIPDTDFQEKLSSIRARLKEAFTTLSSRTSTNVYDRLVEQEKKYEEKKESWETIRPPTQVKAAPATPEKSEPVMAAPAKVEPAKVEPAKVEPAKVEPAKVEPAKVAPAKVAPAKVEPAKVEPAKADPSKTDPGKGDPSKTDPNVKTDPENWARRKNADESKVLFQQAKRAYREQDFWRTIELCRASIELTKENDAERFHLLGKALSQNPRWRQDAEQNLKIAHNLKPWEPRYIVSMAKLYEKVGLHQRANRLYDQVRAMDPDFPIGEDPDIKKSKPEASDEADLEDQQVI